MGSVDSTDTKRTVKSAVRVLQILDILAINPDGLILTELQEKSGIPISSLHGLMSSLEHMNYVKRSDDSRRYKLRTKLLQFTSILSSYHDLITISDPIMNQIKEETSEATSLSILEGDSILFIHKNPAPGRIQIINPAGSRLPSHATGSGKVMLAYLEDEELETIFPDEMLPQVTSRTITSKSRLKQELMLIRERGYAYDDEESSIGVWAVASCIRKRSGKPIASLSVVAPISRVQSKDSSNWPELVRRGAIEISNSLEYLPEMY